MTRSQTASVNDGHEICEANFEEFTKKYHSVPVVRYHVNPVEYHSYG